MSAELPEKTTEKQNKEHLSLETTKMKLME